MEQKSTWMFVALIALSLLIFLLDKAGILSNARGLIEGIVIVPEKAAHQVIIAQKSQEEYATQEEKQAELEKLKKENEDLRLQLGIVKSDSQKLILASVLSTSRGFIIDKGADDGIRAGQTVVFKNIFVGKITTVGKKISKVLLPFENGSIVKVKTSQTKDLGLVKGQGQETLLFEVLLSENLKEDDVLLTAGDVDEQGLGVRPDVLVGKIANVHKSDNQLFQEAKVIPLIDLKNVRHVFVIP